MGHRLNMVIIIKNKKVCCMISRCTLNARIFEVSYIVPVFYVSSVLTVLYLRKNIGFISTFGQLSYLNELLVMYIFLCH